MLPMPTLTPAEIIGSWRLKSTEGIAADIFANPGLLTKPLLDDVRIALGIGVRGEVAALLASRDLYNRRDLAGILEERFGNK